METYSWAWTALELRFNTPGHGGAVVLGEDYVDDFSVDVFSVD